MMTEQDIQYEQAMVLFERAIRQQREGQLAEAIQLYERSIDVYPTAKAYTNLGWVYSMINRFDTAIEMCHEAILLDPTYGHAYNDIGSYLISLNKWDEAVSWLERAIDAPEYRVQHFPYINMGRVHEHQGQLMQALAYYNKALEMEPMDMNAYRAKYALLGKLN